MTDGDAAPRRDRILSAAASEFAQHGFAGARVERIAATAGVNKQLLFHYFGSKRGLHHAALRSLLERPAAPAQPTTPPAERLRGLVVQLTGTVEAHPALLAILASPGSDPETERLARDWTDRAKRQGRQILQDGQKSGYLRDDADVDSVAEVVVGAALGWAAASDRGTAGRRHSYLESLLRMTVEYCSWR